MPNIVLAQETNHVFEVFPWSEVIHSEHGKSKEGIKNQHFCRRGQNRFTLVTGWIFHQPSHIRDGLNTGKAKNKAREDSPNCGKTLPAGERLSRSLMQPEQMQPQ